MRQRKPPKDGNPGERLDETRTWILKEGLPSLREREEGKSGRRGRKQKQKQK